VTQKTKVCSDHFKRDDYTISRNGQIRRHEGAIPSVFNWTQHAPYRKSPRTRLSPRKRLSATTHVIETDVNPVSTTDDNIAASSDIIDIEQLNRVLPDHDYISVVPTTDDKLDAAVAEIDRLKYIIDTYNMERFSIERYVGSPDLLNFYTGFSNYQTLKNFYCTLAPSASTMIAWTQFRRSNVRVCDFRDSCSSTALPLIDQFF
jgi:hypothetical protein